MKKFKPTYSVLAVYPISEVLPFTYFGEEVGGEPNKTYNVLGTDYRVAMGSLRYRTFYGNQTCVTCGRVGTIMRLESSCSRNGVPQPVHFNLYAVEGFKHILMTKDHIIPVTKGGGDELSNLQTMCQPCNLKKGNKLPNECNLVIS